MSHDFDDELERSTERRSRRNPRMRDTAAYGSSGQEGGYASERERWESRQRKRQEAAERELDVMGDSRIHAIPKQPKRESSQEPVSRSYAPDMLDEMEMGRGRGTSRRRGSAVRADLGQENTGNRACDSDIRSSAARETAGSRAVRKAAAGRTTGGNDRRGGRSDFGQSEAKKKRRRRIIAMIVAECIALVAIFSYAFMARMMSKIQRSEDFQISEIKTNDIAVDAEENMKGYWTIAIFGVDARDNSIEKSTNSDVIILCNINRDTGEIKLVSVYRDSYLNINDKGAYSKINQAYFVGGPKQAVEALNRNLDLQIQDYMTFNWKAVANAIDVLGGVDIELSKAEFFYINSFITETVKATGIGSRQLTHAGMNHLDGVQAVAYGRLRLMDTDYARTERQRIILQKAFDKAKNADWATLNCLIQTIMPQLATNVDITDLIPLARNIAKFHIGETAGFPAARGEQDVGKIGDCVIPQTLEYNVKELHKFLFDEEDYQVPSNVKEYSSHIAQVTGLTTNAKLIGHVPVDQGVSAQTFIKKRASRIAAQAAAKDAAKKSSTSASDESNDESGDETKKGESESSIGLDEIFDPDEDWIDWEEEESKSNSSKGPGTTTTPGKKNHTDKTTEADDSLSGPGSTSETKSSIAKPGSTTTTAAETSASSEKTSPGASDNSGVKSPVTEIQEPGDSGNSDAAGPGGPAGPGA